MKDAFSRRQFLKLGALSLGALAFRPQLFSAAGIHSGEVARVGTDQVSVHSQPNDASRIVASRYRDDLINIYETISSPAGPDYNPIWYRIWGGYVHSAHLHRMRIRLNTPLRQIAGERQLAEVTVPYTEALRLRPNNKWEFVYRMYADSTHWIVSITRGPDDEPWYQLEDELGGLRYFVPAAHLRPIPLSEMEPISPNVPAGKKRVEVNLLQQTLTAFEEEKIVFQTKISSGVPQSNPPPGLIPTNTPKGTFHITSKMPSKHMGDGYLPLSLEGFLDAYILQGVPWVSFFEPQTGVAFHGTYWHENFGVPMSHGCVNMRTAEAKWLFRWVTPPSGADVIEQTGYGTRVDVI